jgi:hypothetical protein
LGGETSKPCSKRGGQSSGRLGERGHRSLWQHSLASLRQTMTRAAAPQRAGRGAALQSRRLCVSFFCCDDRPAHSWVDCRCICAELPANTGHAEQDLHCVGAKRLLMPLTLTLTASCHPHCAKASSRRPKLMPLRVCWRTAAASYSLYHSSMHMFFATFLWCMPVGKSV